MKFVCTTFKQTKNGILNSLSLLSKPANPKLSFHPQLQFNVFKSTLVLYQIKSLKIPQIDVGDKLTDAGNITLNFLTFRQLKYQLNCWICVASLILICKSVSITL